MSRAPTAESLYERLKQAREHTEVVLTIDDAPNIVEMNQSSPPTSSWAARLSIDRFLDEGTWRAQGPGFQRLREWVEVHWNPERETAAPKGTVAASDVWGPGNTQLDAVSAAKKLIVAARLYGGEEVARHAAEFATHGMIEVHSTYLLKGPPIEATKSLDDYCTLLPYAEASGKPDAESSQEDSMRIAWPEPRAGNVCALESRYFERVERHAGERERHMSLLMKDGPEHLALLLGLVWGCGFRVFGNWHNVPAPAAAALPYRHMTWERGSGNRLVTLAAAGYGPAPRKRPLAVEELRGLVSKFSDRSEQTRLRLRRAMERVRTSTE